MCFCLDVLYSNLLFKKGKKREMEGRVIKTRYRCIHYPNYNKLRQSTVYADKP